MIYWIILVVWVIGMVVTWCLIRKTESTFPVKFVELVIWPLTLVLYIIYLIHKKC